LYIINGEGILKSNLPENAVYEVSESIEMVKPKNAVARYGSNAKDGAMVFNGTATTQQNKGATPATSYHFNTNLNGNLITSIPIFKYRITKNTTDAELEEIKKELLSKYNTTFTYTVKRNANNEIISLKLTHKDNNGNSGNYNISDTTPINDVTFFKTDKGFGFGQAKDHDRLSELMERKEELIEKRHHIAVERREMLEEKREEMREGMREQKEALREKRKEMRRVYGIGKKRTDSMRSRRQSIFIEKEGDEPTIIVDGVVYSGDLKDLDSDNIATINVIKDTDGVNAYGISNDNGIIVIDTKTLSDQVNGWVDDFVFDFTNGDDNNTENIYITKDTTMQDLENIKDEMNAKGKSFNYKRVKRNSQGEITNIKIIFDDNSGNKQSLSKQGNGNSPIKDILIAY